MCSDSERMSTTLLFGCRCLLGHVNMSPAALEQCVTDIFANQTIENIQRIRRLGSYHKSNSMPKCISLFSKNFNPGVIFALDQIMAKNQSCKFEFDSEELHETSFRGVTWSFIQRSYMKPHSKKFHESSLEKVSCSIIFSESSKWRRNLLPRYRESSSLSDNSSSGRKERQRPSGDRSFEEGVVARRTDQDPPTSHSLL